MTADGIETGDAAPELELPDTEGRATALPAPGEAQATVVIACATAVPPTPTTPTRPKARPGCAPPWSGPHALQSGSRRDRTGRLLDQVA